MPCVQIFLIVVARLSSRGASVCLHLSQHWKTRPPLSLPRSHKRESRLTDWSSLLAGSMMGLSQQNHLELCWWKYCVRNSSGSIRCSLCCHPTPDLGMGLSGLLCIRAVLGTCLRWGRASISVRGPRRGTWEGAAQPLERLPPWSSGVAFSACEAAGGPSRGRFRCRARQPVPTPRLPGARLPGKGRARHWEHVNCGWAFALLATRFPYTRNRERTSLAASDCTNIACPRASGGTWPELRDRVPPVTGAGRDRPGPAGALRKVLAGAVGPAQTCGCCLELRLNSTHWKGSCPLPRKGTRLGRETQVWPGVPSFYSLPPESQFPSLEKEALPVHVLQG